MEYMIKYYLILSVAFCTVVCNSEEALAETNYAGIDIAVEWLLITDECQTKEKTDKIVDDEEEKVNLSAEENSRTDKPQQEPLRSMYELTIENRFCFNLQKYFSETRIVSNSIDVAKNSDKTTRMLARLLDGKTISKSFNAQEKLMAVRVWIESTIKTDKFGLMTSFPKKVFTDEDYDLSLEILNLVPSGVVIVTQLEKWCNLKVYDGKEKNDEIRKIEEKRRKEEVEKQLKERDDERKALERVRAQIEDDKAARRQRWPR